MSGQLVPLYCTRCRSEIPKSSGWDEATKTVTCPKCGTSAKLDDILAAGAKQIEKDSAKIIPNIDIDIEL